MVHSVTISVARIAKKTAFWMISVWILASCSTQTGEAVAREAGTDGGEAQQPATAVTAAVMPAASFLADDFPDEESLAAIYDLFSEYDRDDAPGCAVAVYRNGEMAHSAAFGMANLDHSIPLTDSSRFYMASVSKQVTAAAAALLVVRSEVDYDGLVSGYIEDWPEWASDVRVKHLFNHTSGLPDIYDLMDIAGTSLSNVMTIDDYMSVFFGGEALKNRPGSAYSYTNSGYTALAKLVEVVSGKSFAEFVESELLEPLGMTSTHFHDDRTRVIPNRVISYTPISTSQTDADDEGEQGSEYSMELPAFRQTYLSNFQGVGPGGLYSTLKDWKLWESFWLETNDLPDEFEELRTMMTRREVVRGDTLKYALGLDVEVWQGVRMEGHSGSFMGFKTDVRRFPEQGVALLTLCNREDVNPGRMNRQMAKILLKEVFEAFLMPYEGTYRNEELQIDYKLTVEDGSLRLHRRLSPRGTMNEEERDKWRAGSWDFVFQRDEYDYITGFVVSTGRAREVEFIRKNP